MSCKNPHQVKHTLDYSLYFLSDLNNRDSLAWDNLFTGLISNLLLFVNGFPPEVFSGNEMLGWEISRSGLTEKKQKQKQKLVLQNTSFVFLCTESLHWLLSQNISNGLAGLRWLFVET